MNTNREQMGLDTHAFKRPIISGLGATRTLTEGESGSLIVLDKVDGIVITLPLFTDSGKAGTWFEFVVGASCTSNSYKIITGVNTELLVGSIINCDTDSSDVVAIWKSLVATGNLSVNLNGSTKGGLKGDTLRFTQVNATTWQVSGITNGTGTVATPFATS